jgi:tetratricopeptide (TPR) repeat protein
MSAQCWINGRVEDAVRYGDAGQPVIDAGDELDHGAEGWLYGAYQAIGQPDRMVEWCRSLLARGRNRHTLNRTALVVALTTAGRYDEAIADAEGLVAAAEATNNPYAISFALLAYGIALREADAEGALDALHRGLSISSASGNRNVANHLLLNLSRQEAMHGDRQAALDYLSRTIRNYHDAGNASLLDGALAVVAFLMNQLGRRAPAATIAGSAYNTLTAISVPELITAIADLREVLGEEPYESLARAGKAMTTAEIVSYAYAQIDEAKTVLELA